MLPIPLEVSKNFTDGEEPIMNYADVTYGETVFPFFIAKGTDYSLTVLNIYQNWGRFPQKQLSSIAYYAPYYHLSVGITETSCIAPWYVHGRTLWTLPDFRPLSAPYWFELNGSAFQNEPQHSNAGLFEIVHYTDANGRYVAPENYMNVIDSSGPVYAEVKMSYLSDDGKMHVTYNHLELPQTDELRTYYEVKIDILEDIDINDFKHDFAFYSWNTPRNKVGYLDSEGNHKEQDYSASDSITEYVLGKESPYFGNFGIESNNATNLGFLIHSHDMTIGGEKFNGNFVVVEKGKNDFGLSLDLEKVTLKKGDTITLNIIMIPWGSHLSTNASNLAVLRENSSINPYTITSPDSATTNADSIWLGGSNFKKDDNWHVVIFDAATFRPDTFKAASDGSYYCKYIRFDVFNAPMSPESYIDIAYVGIADSIESLCKLNSDMDEMTLFSKGKTETVDVKTGNITGDSGNSGSGTTPPPVDTEVTISKDTSSVIDPNNVNGYKASSVHYFARFDSINGYGPGQSIGYAYDTGSNDVSGFSVFKYNGDATADKRLVLAGWNLVQGGVEKYVWSADGGKTWNEVVLHGYSVLDDASSGMLDYAKIKYPLNINFSQSCLNSSYQGGLSGPSSARGIAADLSQYAGQTVDVTFAVVPSAESDSLCILAHITGVKVPQ